MNTKNGGMGQLQDNLMELLGGQVCDRPRPSLALLKNRGLLPELQRIYRELGGKKSEIPTRAGKWDMEVDGVAIELDEQLHFNRYRALTLESDVYAYLPHFPLKTYQQYCTDKEDDCLKTGSYGGKWSNPSCAKQFGEGDAPGMLGPAGSPRWKQRAFYDLLKDMAPLTLDFPCARLSIWDPIQLGNHTVTLEAALRQPESDLADKVRALAVRRAKRRDKTWTPSH